MEEGGEGGWEGCVIRCRGVRGVGMGEGGTCGLRSVAARLGGWRS